MNPVNQILRVFEVTAKPGCGEKLLSKLSKTSITVVRDKPGNLGYYFGKQEGPTENDLVFISVWKDMDSIKLNFGEDWQGSFLPEGYEEIIEKCSIKHFNVSGELG